MMVRIGNFFFRYRNGLFPLMFVLMFLDSPKLFPNHTLAVILGFAVALTGQVLRAVTIGLAYIIRGGRNRQVYAEKLVQEGVFAHCRNPLYVGNLLVIIGLGLISNSMLFLFAGVPFFVFAYRAIVAAEENFLRQKFGAEFDEYCKRVGRFVPNFAGSGRTLRGMEFKWQRLIVKEYGSTFAWLATACGLLIKERWQHTRTFAEPQIEVFMGALVLLMAAFAVARYMKKSRMLVAD